MSVWDGANRKRLAQLPPAATSISALAFSADGALLAVGESYGYEAGEAGLAAAPGDCVRIERLREADVRPKPRQATTA